MLVEEFKRLTKELRKEHIKGFEQLSEEKQYKLIEELKKLLAEIKINNEIKSLIDEVLNS